MTTLNSNSAAESSMDDENLSNTLQTLTKPNSRSEEVDMGGEGGGGGGGDAEVWGKFTENFREVQSVLDRNRVLIQQVNENHQSKIHENLVKNVALIQEINNNISKVVSLYSHLSTNFSTMFHQRNNNTNNNNNNNAQEDEEE